MQGKMTLWDAMYAMLKTGAPATPYLMQRLLQVEADYNDGKADDLAELFGFATTAADKRRLNHETFRSQVKQAVEEQIRRGYPRLNPHNEEHRESAFTRAAEAIGIATPDGEDVKPRVTAQTVFDIYYDKDSAGKRIKAQLGEKKK